MPAPALREVEDILLSKVWKSVEERYPLVLLVAWAMERVEPEKDSGADTVVDCATPLASVERVTVPVGAEPPAPALSVTVAVQVVP